MRKGLILLIIKDLTKVRELKRDGNRGTSKVLDHGLEIVFALGRNAYLVPLNGRLHFDGKVFDHLHDLFGFFLRDPLRKGYFLPEATVKGALRSFEIQGLGRYLAAGHPGLQDILKVPEFHIVVGDNAELLFFFVLEEFNRALAAFEIKPVLELFFGLIDGIINLLKIDLGNNIER